MKQGGSSPSADPNPHSIDSKINAQIIPSHLFQIGLQLHFPKCWKSYLEGSIGGTIPLQFKLAVITDATCGNKQRTKVCNPVPSPIEDATPVRTQKRMNQVTFQTGGKRMKRVRIVMSGIRMNLFLRAWSPQKIRLIMRRMRIPRVRMGFLKREIWGWGCWVSVISSQDIISQLQMHRRLIRGQMGVTSLDGIHPFSDFLTSIQTHQIPFQ